MSEEKSNIFTLFRNADLSQHLATKALIGVVLVVILALMFPRGESIELDYKVGEVWVQKDLIAPFSFPVYRDEREYAAEVEQVKKQVYPVFERDPEALQRQSTKLKECMDRLYVTIRLRSEYRRALREKRVFAAVDSARLSRAMMQLEISFDAHEWDVLTVLDGKGKLKEIDSSLDKLLGEYLRVGVLNTLKSGLNRVDIAVRRGTFEEITQSAKLYDEQDVISLLAKQLHDIYETDDDAALIASKIGVNVVAPNIRFDNKATEQATRIAVESVPLTIGTVQENERVVGRHERITAELKLKLDSLRRARAERGSESGGPIQMVGILLHVIIVVMLYGIYLYLFRKRIFANNRHLALIALLLLLEGFFAYVTRELNVNSPTEYLIVVPAASMLLTIIFDSRVGFYGTVIIAFLIAGIRGNDYSMALASVVAGALSVYTVRDVKNRTQIFRSLGFIFMGYSLSIVALTLERSESISMVVEQLMFALANAVISPVLTYGLLIFVERVFRVTTDLTLIELSQFNHPLLRQLAERAPGTYHHSMTMASLAEAAAAAVGANEVLARVGAYFHDIGKIVKPTYFAENQKGSRNRHDKLAPRMSSLIIAAHIKDGIAMAREHNLPDEVIDFIPMHHGTTRMEYFYNKALAYAQNSPDETKIDEIKEQDYRYLGPKPQTKETGILMLADAIEATVRTLDDPSPQRLEVVINDLIKSRFEEGELDECPLTLKDLTKIKAAFLGILVGIYHSRVKYPEIPKKRAPRKAQSPMEGISPTQGEPHSISESSKE